MGRNIKSSPLNTPNQTADKAPTTPAQQTPYHREQTNNHPETPQQLINHSNLQMAPILENRETTNNFQKSMNRKQMLAQEGIDRVVSKAPESFSRKVTFIILKMIMIRKIIIAMMKSIMRRKDKKAAMEIKKRALRSRTAMIGIRNNCRGISPRQYQ